MSLPRSTAFCAALTLLGSVAAAPPSVAAECRLKEVTAIPASFNARGRIVLDAAIDGDPVKLVLDTGSVFDILGESYVRRRGMPIIETRELGFGLSGKELRRVTRISQLNLGNLVARDPIFLVGEVGDDGATAHPVGLFGTEYLAKFDVELDPAAGQVKLFSPDHCPGDGVYWAKEYFRLPVHLTRYYRLEAQIEVDGKELKALIDTGAQTTTMRLAAAQDLFGIGLDSAGAAPPGKIHGADGVKLDAIPHIFHSLSFGGITLNDTKMIVADIDQGKGTNILGTRIEGNHAQPDVLIGMSLLRQLHLFIAYSEPAIYFTIAETKPAG